jgi:[ribosomal protein S18]-alanine N-acetyltransferase
MDRHKSANVQKKIVANIRWRIYRDVNEIVSIDRGCFEFPWSRNKFLSLLRQKKIFCFVAEHNEAVIGFAVFKSYKTGVNLLRFAVQPRLQRHGVGRQMIFRVISEILNTRQTHIIVKVGKTNATAIKFLHSADFRLANVPPDFFDKSPIDTQFMRYNFRETEYKPIQPLYRFIPPQK